MRRKVIRAKVHDMAVVIPGIGALEKELPPINKTVKMEMYLDSDHQGVMFIKVGSHETFVPLANIQIGFLGPIEAEESKPTTKK